MSRVTGMGEVRMASSACCICTTPSRGTSSTTRSHSSWATWRSCAGQDVRRSHMREAARGVPGDPGMPGALCDVHTGPRAAVALSAPATQHGHVRHPVHDAAVWRVALCRAALGVRVLAAQLRRRAQHRDKCRRVHRVRRDAAVHGQADLVRAAARALQVQRAVCVLLDGSVPERAARLGRRVCPLGGHRRGLGPQLTRGHTTDKCKQYSP
ncbi:hypothetical protein FI667_g5949, partial [Globisporangium splendens]